MVTEGLLLSSLGGLLGYVLGQWVTWAYVSRLDLGADLPLRFDATFDMKVFFFSLARGRLHRRRCRPVAGLARVARRRARGAARWRQGPVGQLAPAAAPAGAGGRHRFQVRSRCWSSRDCSCAR